MNKVIYQITRGVVITFISLLAITILLLFIIPTTLSIIAGKDVKMVDDSNFKLDTINIPEHDNMYYDLEKVIDVIDVDIIENYKNKIFDSDKWKKENVTELLAKNKETFKIIDNATKKSLFQSPATANPNNISYDSRNFTIDHYREIARLSAVKAIWLAKNNKIDEAYNESLKIVSIGDAIGKSQCDLMLFLLAMGVKDVGLETYNKITKITDSNILRKKYNKKLSKYQIINNDSFLKIEYLVQKKVVKLIASGDERRSYFDNLVVKNNFYYKPNMIINDKYKIFDIILNDYHNDCGDSNITKTKNNYAQEFSLSDIPKLYFTENAAGILLSTMPELSLRSVKDKKCELEEKIKKIINS